MLKSPENSRYVSAWSYLHKQGESIRFVVKTAAHVGFRRNLDPQESSRSWTRQKKSKEAKKTKYKNILTNLNHPGESESVDGFFFVETSLLQESSSVWGVTGKVHNKMYLIGEKVNFAWLF